MAVSWLDSLTPGRTEEFGFLADTLARFHQHSLPVMNGFIVGSDGVPGFASFLPEVCRLNLKSPHQALEHTHRLRSSISKLTIPHTLSGDIAQAYADISLSSSLRNSAGTTALIEGQRRQDPVSISLSFQEQVPFVSRIENLFGRQAVLDGVQRVLALVASPAVAAYFSRLSSEPETPCLLIQKSPDVDVSCSVFTRDPVTGGPNAVVESFPGFFDPVFSGGVSADRFVLSLAERAVVSQYIADKRTMVLRSPLTGELVTERLPEDRRRVSSLSSRQMDQLFSILERVDQAVPGPLRLDVVFSRSSLFIVGVSPLLYSRPVPARSSSFTVLSAGKTQGTARVAQGVESVNEGEILLLPHLSPDFVLGLRRMAGVVSAEGALSSLFATFARLERIPVLVGEYPSEELNDRYITLDGLEGRVESASQTPDSGPFSCGIDVKVRGGAPMDAEGAFVEGAVPVGVQEELVRHYHPYSVYVDARAEDCSSDRVVRLHGVSELLSSGSTLGLGVNGLIVRTLSELPQVARLLQTGMKAVVVDVGLLSRELAERKGPSCSQVLEHLGGLCRQHDVRWGFLLDGVSMDYLEEAVRQVVDVVIVPAEDVGKTAHILDKLERRKLLKGGC